MSISHFFYFHWLTFPREGGEREITQPATDKIAEDKELSCTAKGWLFMPVFFGRLPLLIFWHCT